MSAVGPAAELCAVCSIRHNVYLPCESAAQLYAAVFVVRRPWEQATDEPELINGEGPE